MHLKGRCQLPIASSFSSSSNLVSNWTPLCNVTLSTALSINVLPYSLRLWLQPCVNLIPSTLHADFITPLQSSISLFIFGINIRVEGSCDLSGCS